MARAHSRFAPSSLHRVLQCPRSVALAEAAVQADPARARSSSYAAEGTVAHEIAANYLRGVTDDGLSSGKVVELEGHEITIDGDMHGYGLEYASYVRSLMRVDSKMMVEEIVRLDPVVGPRAEMFGHLDAATWSPKDRRLDVVDYKYGQGIAVSPEDNPQLMTYALGALFALPKKDRNAIQTIGLHVFQPRLNDGISCWEIRAIDLLFWGGVVLSPLVNLILADDDGLPPLHTGDHCRYCAARSICPAWADKIDAEMRAAFATPIAGLAGADLAAALIRVRKLVPWIEGVEEEARRRLLEGTPGHDDVPGFKPVVSQWRRAWANGSDPDAIALKLGLLAGDVMTAPALRTPADLEKKLPKSERSNLDDLVVRKAYGVSIVAADDPRPDSRESSKAKS